MVIRNKKEREPPQVGKLYRLRTVRFGRRSLDFCTGTPQENLKRVAPGEYFLFLGTEVSDLSVRPFYKFLDGDGTVLRFRDRWTDGLAEAKYPMTPLERFYEDFEDATPIIEAEKKKEK